MQLYAKNECKKTGNLFLISCPGVSFCAKTVILFLNGSSSIKRNLSVKRILSVKRNITGFCWVVCNQDIPFF